MRLDKSQVKRVILYESSSPSTVFNRNPAIMAGYKNYEAMLVGAAGGFSGDCSDGSSLMKTWGAGGGGGGVLKLAGTLASLADTTPVGVGVAGTDGVDQLVEDVQAGSGTDGGVSLFGAHQAYGGKGAIGGRYHVTTSQNLNINEEGGDGGGNSAGLGSGGVGGVCAEQDFAQPGDTRAAVLPTQGTYVVGGVAPVVAGGVGGGGGTGRVKEITTGAGDPKAGSTSQVGSGYSVAGIAPGTNMGGTGAGAKIDTFLDWYGPSGLTSGKKYGTRGVTTADPLNIPNGVVAILLT